MTKTELDLLNRIIELQVDKIVNKRLVEMESKINEQIEQIANMINEGVEVPKGSSTLRDKINQSVLKQLHGNNKSPAKGKPNKLVEKFKDSPLGSIFADTTPMGDDDDEMLTESVTDLVNTDLDRYDLTEEAKDVINIIGNTDFAAKLKKMEAAANSTRSAITNNI